MTAKLTLKEILLNPIVTPSHYDISLDIDLESFEVQGTASVEIHIEGKAIDKLVLHALGLDIDPSSVSWATSASDESAKPLTLATNGLEIRKDMQTASFDFGQPLQPGSGVLRVKWRFKLDDSLAGLYRSKYQNLAGETKYMAVTQFEATDGTKKVKYIYDASPVMSTYLVAVIVGEFDFVSVLAGNGIRTTVYTPRGKSQMGEHALRVASAALQYFEEQFGVKYPLPKSDLLAIPDFASGAMENWGAVTYRETRLLIDAKTTSIGTVQRCTRTVCHELAHMWFGNYVTMQWWTHLWLNEGFARFMEFKATDHIFPEWKIWLTFCYAVHGSALDRDALQSSHPVQVPVNHPDEIAEIFDLISYAKGASIIRMLSDYLGEGTFMNGIQSYLKEYNHGNAKTENLWQHLGDASSRPVQKIMDCWTTKTGYPVVFITEKESNEAAKRVFSLEQKRFGSGEENDTTVWQIPIRIATAGGKSMVILMTSAKTSVEVAAEKDEYIRFNAGQVGFFRCCYTTASSAFEQLAAAVESKTLEPADRLGLQSDAFACAQFGLSPLPLALELALRYKDEPETPVIQELGSNLKGLLKLYREDNVGPLLNELVVKLFKGIVDRLGWEKQPNEPLPDSVCRVSAISALFAARHEETLEALHNMYSNRSSKPIPADLRLLCFKGSMKQAPTETYEELLNIYNVSASAEERKHAMVAFASSSDPTLQKRTLDWVLNGGQLRVQDLYTPLSSVANSKGGAKLVWDWFQTNFSKYEYLSTNQQTVFKNFVSVCLNSLSAEHVSEIETFFETNKVLSAERAISQALERINLRYQRKLQELPVLQEYFGL